MDSFFIILLIVLGYLVLLSFVVSHSDSRRTVSTVAVIVLAIYACVIGGFAVLGEYIGELGLLLYAVAIVYSCLFWSWKVYRLTQEKTQIQTGALLTLIAYILAVLYITIFVREGGTNFKVQMEVLNCFQTSAQAQGGETFRHFLLNVAMFIPLGGVFPFITNSKLGKFLSGVSFGILFSVIIETGQLIFHSGTCDIDDIIANTMGAVIGALFISIWIKLKK